MTDTTLNPYVGPRTFTRQESARFFGREREAQELFSLVISERLVLFYAQSGAGKSSLINTRLAPQLEEFGFAVLPIGRVSGELPQEVSHVNNIFIFNLMLSLDRSEADPNRFAQMSLTHFLARLTSTDGESYYYDAQADLSAEADYEPLHHILIIDQFEEIITTHPERWPEREDFFRQLDEAMAADPLLWVVLTLREEYLAALDPYAHLVGGKFQARFYMQRMEYEAALAAVKRPAAQYGRPFAPGVAETLVDNLRQIKVQGQMPLHLLNAAGNEKFSALPGKGVPGQFVEPVQLQVVCYQLWENLKDRPLGEITAQDLQEAGNVDMALSEFYEQAIQKALAQFNQSFRKVSEIELRNWFDQELITEAGTRGTVYQGATDTAGLPNAIVKLLADQFLLRTEIRAGGTWYELVHDRFIEPILQANWAWWERQNPMIRAARAWADAGRDESKLFLGQPLKEALDSLGQTEPEPLVAEFLAASAAENQALEEKEALRQRELEHAQALAEEQRQRAEEQIRYAKTLRWRSLLALLLACIAVAGMLVAIYFEFLSEARAAAARTQSLVETDPELALLVALASEKVAVADGLTRDMTTEVINEALNWQLPLATFSVHTNTINSVAWSPDGSQLASGSDDQTIIIWDIASRRPLKILTGHTGIVNSIAWSPDGVQLASGSDDKTVIIWNVASGQPLKTFTGHTKEVSSVLWSPDGSQLVSGSVDNTLIIWDIASTSHRTLQGHNDAVRSVAWSPDGSQLASGSFDKAVIVWDVASGKPLRTLRGHDDNVTGIAWSPDGAQLASGSWDEVIIIWDVASGQRLQTLEGHTNTVISVAWNPDGSQLASGSRDNTIIIWDVTSGQPHTTLKGHDGPVRSVAWSPDGAQLASGSGDKTIIIWDAANDLHRTRQKHTRPVFSVAWSPDDSLLASGSVDRTIIIWDIATGQPLKTLQGHTNIVNSLAWSPDGSQLASVSDDKTTIIWDVASGQFLKTLREHTGTVNAVAWSPDGAQLASGSWDKTIIIWDVVSDQPQITLQGHNDAVCSLAWSRDGSQLASGSRDNTIIIWDVTSGQPHLTLKGHKGPVRSVAWNQDGSQLASGSIDRTIIIWDVASGQPLKTLTGHTDMINSITWSPDGAQLASGSTDQTIIIWDVVNAQHLRTVKRTNTIFSVAWN